jgi:hypothetical protein
MARTTSTTEHLTHAQGERLAERVSAASYGTVLVLAALATLKANDVDSGFGWELVVGVGAATWIAHLFAEVVGEHCRSRSTITRHEVRRAMTDGLPIILAAVAPALVLGLGRLDVLENDVAMWLAVSVAFLQLVGLGAFVGAAISPHRSTMWAYAAVTALMGAVVVALKIALSH